jgi:hypothetical protein
MAFNRPVPDKHREKQESSGSGLDTLVQAEKLMQIAILLPCSVFIGWLPGAWLDHKLHQEWIGLTGMIFGGVCGLVYVVRLVMRSGTDANGKEKE